MSKKKGKNPTALVSHGILPFLPKLTKIGAESRTRTGDPFITNEMLYQLSYFGKVCKARKMLFPFCGAKI